MDHCHAGDSRRPARVLGALVVGIALASTPAASAQSVFPTGVLGRAMDFATTPEGEVFAVLGTHSFGMYRSKPGNSSPGRWMIANVGLPQPLVVNAVEVLAGGDVLIGTVAWGGLYRSRDGGASWEVVDPSAFGGTFVYAVTSIAESVVDGKVYLSLDDGTILISSDGGESFAAMGALPGGPAQVPTVIAAHPTRAGVLFAGTAGLGVFVSQDDGASWTAVFGNASLTGATAGHVFDLRFDPAEPSRLYAATARGVWRTRLDAEPWTLVGARQGVTSILLEPGTELSVNPETRSIAISQGGTLYAATWGHGLLQIPDPLAGTQFTHVPMGDGYASLVRISPTNELMVSTQRGLVIRQLASPTARGTAPEVPQAPVLRQNWPNPFNPDTSIRFDLPAAGHVRLSVFDLTGREIAVLADGNRPAGRHEVRFEAGGLRSGLYLYRLVSDAGTQARTMTLIR